jgi:two-component system chemotaxis response regulator CheY
LAFQFLYLPCDWRASGMEASPSRDMRVLIADDQKDVGRSLADLVRYCNHEVVAIVGSGLEAINAYSLHHPDLVLMDYRMPKLNGGTACRHIIAKDPAARVILVTAWSPSDEAGGSGAIAIMPKPVALDRLNALLETVAQTLPAPAPAEMPLPEAGFQPESIDYSNTCSQFVDQPTPNSELQAPTFPPVAAPVAVVPSSLETSFPVDVPPDDLPRTGEVRVLDQKKISRKRRSKRAERHGR